MNRLRFKLTQPIKMKVSIKTTHIGKVSTCCTYVLKLWMKAKVQTKKISVIHTNTSPNLWYKKASIQAPRTYTNKITYSRSTNWFQMELSSLESTWWILSTMRGTWYQVKCFWSTKYNLSQVPVQLDSIQG